MSQSEEQKIFVKVFGSSHVDGKHFLPQEFDFAMKLQSKFAKPIFNGQGGREINQGIVNYIFEEAMMYYVGTQLPQVWVIFLGTNNIRFKEENILPYFEDLAKQCGQIPKCNIVFSGLIPSPKTDTITHQRFMNVNRKLNFKGTFKARTKRSDQALSRKFAKTSAMKSSFNSFTALF